MDLTNIILNICSIEEIEKITAQYNACTANITEYITFIKHYLLTYKGLNIQIDVNKENEIQFFKQITYNLNNHLTNNRMMDKKMGFTLYNIKENEFKYITQAYNLQNPNHVITQRRKEHDYLYQKKDTECGICQQPL